MNCLDVVHQYNDEQLCATVDHSSYLMRGAAVVEMARRGLKTPQAKQALERAENDHAQIWKHSTVSMLASAALDSLGLKPYQGDEGEVRRLIPGICNM